MKAPFTDEEVDWLWEGHNDIFGNQLHRIATIIQRRMEQAWDEGRDAHWDRERDLGLTEIPTNPYVSD